MTAPAVAAWRAMLHSGDTSGLDALLADAVVFESPVVHTPQAGRRKTALYLRAADRVLNNGTFRYVGEWHARESAVLEFNVTVDGVEVDGVDMIWWDAEDRIVRFKVMVRPLKAIDLLRRKMAETLERMAAERQG